MYKIKWTYQSSVTISGAIFESYDEAYKTALEINKAYYGDRASFEIIPYES